MGFQLLLGVEGSQVSLCYLLGFIRCMSSLWEKFKNSLLAGLFFFFKENCCPLIKLEFIPLKLTCHRPQQAGKGSPAGPGNSSNAPINCSWTRKNGTSHNPLTDSMCALRCLCFYFLRLQLLESWDSCHISVVLFRKKRQEVSTSNWGWDWKRGPLGLRHEKISKGIVNPSHECFFESLPHDFESPEVGYAAAGSGPVVQGWKVNYAGDLHRWSAVKCTPEMYHPQACGWHGT